MLETNREVKIPLLNPFTYQQVLEIESLSPRWLECARTTQPDSAGCNRVKSKSIAKLRSKPTEFDVTLL